MGQQVNIHMVALFACLFQNTFILCNYKMSFLFKTQKADSVGASEGRMYFLRCSAVVSLLNKATTTAAATAARLIQLIA